MISLQNYKSLWDFFSDKLGTTIFHPQYFAKKYAREAIVIAKKISNGTLLDIGCGRMPYRSEFLPSVTKYIGLDHPETAKLYMGDLKPDIYANATKIPLRSKSIDTVLMLMVLEHLPDPLLALSEANRLLNRKNGKLILSTVQMYPTHDAPFDYFRYTRYGLKSIFEDSGFKVRKIISQGNVWSVLGISLNVYLFQSVLSLLKSKKTIILGMALSPLFYLITFLTNLLLFIPERLTSNSNSKFNISHVVFAIPK